MTDRELVITRLFDAPPPLVFKAWTDPKYMAQWWGPKDFTNPVCCRRLGFDLIEQCDFEYPAGHFMRCNDWRLHPSDVG